MHRATALLAGLLFAACGRGDSPGESACPHDPGFDRSQVILVRANIPPAVIRRDLDLAGIAAETGGAVGSALQGLTSIKDQISYRTLLKLEKSRGRTCVWFDSVKIDLTAVSVDIFVPREYPDDSCEFLAVLEHEREHERVHAERLTAAAEEIDRALTSANWLPARGNPFETDDRASAEAALEAKIRKVVTPVYDKYREDLAAAQAELDKPELYQWATRRCSGWK